MKKASVTTDQIKDGHQQWSAHKVIILYIECDRRGGMEDDSAPIEHSWSVSAVGKIEPVQYTYIVVMARLSAHTDWSAVFNWRITHPLSYSTLLYGHHHLFD